MADVHLGNLSVGEVWPERKNVVIVGSSETSIPLYCTGARGRCALEDKKTSTLVDILPGMTAFYSPNCPVLTQLTPGTMKINL